MTPKLLYLRFVYWLGILLDAGAAVLLMFPSLNARFSGWTGYENTQAFVSVSGYAAALMLGWTLLLYWASLKPVERRGVLLLTAFPVLLGVIITRVLELQVSTSPWLPAGLIQPILIVLFVSAYLAAAPKKSSPVQEGGFR